MTKPEFVDAHVHFYDMGHPELFYAHWQPDEDHPVLGAQTRKLAERNWLAEDFIAVSRDSNVTKAVHVQAAIGSDDPVKETEWLQEASDRTGFPHAIVAYADLRDPGVEAVLERHCEFPNMKGVRDFSYGDYLVEPDFHRGYALMAKYDLVASIAAQWQDMEKLRDLAAAFPNTVIVIDHAGGPMERTPEYFNHWKQGMRIGRRGGEHYLQDLRSRHGRPQLDRREHQAVRAALHRDVRRRAEPVRHQLASGQPVERTTTRSSAPTTRSPATSPTTSAARCSLPTQSACTASDRQCHNRRLSYSGSWL